ncbi:hypothetical protein DL98DRAFT_577709 [Cadophora sp. DSE1049]|nr:hypothetical protein DL98DRAFT_577709 [Cadophora sp. DSE1049]
MPKNWSSHEEDIRQLYIVEGKPLKEVRDIMAADHRFEASTRAYRMYFDSLGWKKNASVKSRRAQKRSVRCITTPIPTDTTLRPRGLSPRQVPGTIQSQFLSDINLSTQESFAALYGITLPLGVIDAKEVLSLVQWAPPAVGLQALLLKWQSDGSYLRVSQDLILDNHYRFDVQFRTFSGGTIFQLIEERVNTHERLQLGRACIEADLECRESQRQQYVNGIYPSPDFQSTESEPFWETAYKATEWHEAKRIFSAAAGHSDFTPKLVLESSLFVVAESFFKRYKEQLDSLRARCYPHTLESEEVSVFRSRYMELLNDLNSPMMNVGLSWHKHAINIIEWDRAVAIEEMAHLRLLLKVAEEGRDRALGVYKLYTSVGTNTDLLQYESVGTSMEQPMFFSVGTSIDTQQYESTSMSAETAVDDFGCIQGSSNMIEDPVSSNETTVLVDSQTSMHYLLRHKQTVESPRSPVYSPEPPTYSPSSPVYSPTSPVYSPVSPASDRRNPDPSGSPSISPQRAAESDFLNEYGIINCSPSEAIQCLQKLWTSGRSIRSHVHTLLQEDSYETSLFCPSCIGAENIFDLINQIMKSADRISFTAKVLNACRWFPEDLYHCESPSYKWWLKLYTSMNVEDFQEALELQPIHLQKVMSSEAIDLLVTCTTFVVATDLLGGLKSEIRSGQSLALLQKDSKDAVFDVAEFNMHCEQYVDMLEWLRHQKVGVAESWYDFLLEMMKWEFRERRWRKYNRGKQNGT